MLHEFSQSAFLVGLPAGPQGHFRLHYYAVLARALTNLRAIGANDVLPGLFERFPFLAGYHAALASYQEDGLQDEVDAAWWDGQLASWEAQQEGHLPLRALAHTLDLSAEELRMLLAAGLVEEDIRFGALFAALQEPMLARRPCVGVLGWLMGELDKPPLDAWSICNRLIESGLLVAENRGDPRAEWVLRVPSPLWDAITGRQVVSSMPGLALQPACNFPILEDLILPPPLAEEISRLPSLLNDGGVGAVALRGMTGSGRRTVLGSLARTTGKDVLLWEGASPAGEQWSLVGPLATLAGAVPVLRCELGPGEALHLPLIPAYRGPVGITLTMSGGLRGPLMSRTLGLNLPPPDLSARRRFWQRSGVRAEESALGEIASRFLFTGGHIHRAATLSRAYAALDNRVELLPFDVQRASRALNRQALDTLATHLEPVRGWTQLVVGGAIRRELQALEVRCRRRETLREEAGPAFVSSLTRGVRALFTGPSGTGKTLTARALASVLGMDLYRVDLAAVVNKYIGETERNLNTVLSKAEELDVVLLLDEGDALMTSRTEVRNANDRYANLETNYLLQRLETYEGIVIITTNAGQRIDQAFLRRLDVIIDFAPPDAAERWLIWQSHLPGNHAIAAEFLQEVASRCQLSGGQIRNAALHATLLALSESAPAGNAHVEAALLREYRKAGAAYPLRDKPGANGHMSRLQQFADELS